MPTYEYRCPQGHEFEKVQRMSEPPLAACPECGAAAQRLLSSGGGLLFKGSGFYITDNRSEGYKKAAEKEKPAGSDKSADSGAKSKGGPDTGAGSSDATKPAGGADKSGGKKPDA
ncbi:MAG: FmdB family zinc ribbon protein [Longimicrobiales bacterium]